MRRGARGEKEPAERTGEEAGGQEWKCEVKILEKAHRRAGACVRQCKGKHLERGPWGHVGEGEGCGRGRNAQLTAPRARLWECPPAGCSPAEREGRGWTDPGDSGGEGQRAGRGVEV